VRVAIVGMGFGALSAAHAAEREGIEVVQIGPRHFEYLPSLAKVLSGRRKPEELRVEPKLRWDHVEGLVDKVEDQGDSVRLRLSTGEVLDADYAVLAPGAEPWVPVRGVNPLYRVSHAEAVKRALDKAGRDARIAIVGTGLVGLEAAGELAWTREAGLSSYKVFLLEAAPVLSPTLPCERVREVIPERLRRHGIAYFLNSLVSEIRDNKIITKDGRTFEADVVIWAAGVQGPNIDIPCAEKGKRGFIMVDSYLRAKGCRRVYVVGDASSDSSLKMAEEALRHGWYVIKHLLGKKREPYKPFLTRERPFCFIALGPRDGISIMRRVVITGRLAPMVKELLERIMIKWARDAKMRPPVPI